MLYFTKGKVDRQANVLDIFGRADPENKHYFPLFISKGFPSPAVDYAEQRLNPDDYLVKNKASTFFARVIGNSMIDAGIFPNDVVVIDRSITPSLGDIVMVELDGEFMVRFLSRCNSGALLIPANNKFSRIAVEDNPSFSVWGVVTGTMGKFR